MIVYKIHGIEIFEKHTPNLHNPTLHSKRNSQAADRLLYKQLSVL